MLAGWSGNVSRPYRRVLNVGRMEGEMLFCPANQMEDFAKKYMEEVQRKARAMDTTTGETLGNVGSSATKDKGWKLPPHHQD